jgi:hypothetical protein
MCSINLKQTIITIDLSYISKTTPGGRQGHLSPSNTAVWHVAMALSLIFLDLVLFLLLLLSLSLFLFNFSLNDSIDVIIHHLLEEVRAGTDIRSMPGCFQDAVRLPGRRGSSWPCRPTIPALPCVFRTQEKNISFRR